MYVKVLAGIGDRDLQERGCETDRNVERMKRRDTQGWNREGTECEDEGKKSKIKTIEERAGG